jgi:hypothetical protein
MGDNIHYCQMTTGNKTLITEYARCGKPAKFRNPKPSMGVEFLCGTHAHSVDALYKRTNQNLECIPLDK